MADLHRTFPQRVSGVRRVRRKENPIEMRAANSASQSAEKGTELWDSLYKAKILEYRLDKKISVMKDAADSIRLNG